MDRGQLHDDLLAFGEQLVGAKTASAAEMASGMGMALLALAELLKANPPMAEQPSGETQPTSRTDPNAGFKAKASRW